jgi:hypothetical protein
MGGRFLAGWLTAHGQGFLSSRLAGFLVRGIWFAAYAAANGLLRVNAFAGNARSIRMNAPSRVWNRNFASTNVLSSAEHAAASSPQSRLA